VASKIESARQRQAKHGIRGEIDRLLIEMVRIIRPPGIRRGAEEVEEELETSNVIEEPLGL